MISSDDHEDSDHHYRRCEERIHEQIEFSSSTFDPNLAAEADEIVAPSSSYDDFLPPLPQHLLPDFSAGLWDVNPSSSCLAVGGNVNDRLSARRSLKADREKIRRDKLNEQFSELASSLELDWQKNDKATILVESIQLMKDLRAEVKRLKIQHEALLEESRDLKQERKDLREEKATLKNETSQLQSQIQECMPWLGSSRMLDGTTFPYPLPLHHHYQANPPTDSSAISGAPHPILAPTPYMPIMSPLGGGGAFHVPSGTPSYAMFGSRSGDGVGIHPYPTYATLSHTPSHVERPYAQYPSPLQPVPGYILPSTVPAVSEHHETSTSSSNISLHNPQNSNSHQLRRSGTSKGGSVPPHQEESARFQSPITQEKRDNARTVTSKLQHIEPTEQCVFSTLMKKNQDFSPTETDLYIMMDGNTLSGKTLSEMESEIELDAILRPPAA